MFGWRRRRFFNAGTERVIIVSDETEAIHYAVEHAKKDALVFVYSDDIQNSLSLIKQLNETEKSK